jgi:hypothetical protein
MRSSSASSRYCLLRSTTPVFYASQIAWDHNPADDLRRANISENDYGLLVDSIDWTEEEFAAECPLER